MSEKVRRTKFYFTDYVNHAIRFYLSTPEKCPVNGKTAASLNNWMAAQSVIYKMPDEEKGILKAVFASKKAVPVNVDTFCQETGTDKEKVWDLVVKTVYKVARVRGLI